MADNFPELREEQEEAAANARLADQEKDEFGRQLSKEKLGQFRQDREERKLYARRIFQLVVAWLGVVVGLLVAQGFLGPHKYKLFSLADSVLIATATTTTASITALLVVVARYLFPRSDSTSRPPTVSGTR